MTPGRVETYGTSFSSRIGSASMSARRTTTLPGRAPWSRATTAVPAGRSISSPPNERSVCSTKADGLVLLERELGVGVQVPPPGDRARLEVVRDEP